MKESEEESGRIGTMLKKGNGQQNENTLTSGTKETPPPAEADEITDESESTDTPTPEPEPVVEPKKRPSIDSSAKIVAKFDEGDSTPRRRRKNQNRDDEE